MFSKIKLCELFYSSIYMFEIYGMAKNGIKNGIENGIEKMRFDLFPHTKFTGAK